MKEEHFIRLCRIQGQSSGIFHKALREVIIMATIYMCSNTFLRILMCLFLTEINHHVNIVKFEVGKRWPMMLPTVDNLENGCQ